MPSAQRVDAVVIGAGFFGLYLAEHLARRGRSVLICEKESGAMQRASYTNQARVHNGYHYPRSVLTALRSRVSFPRFVAEFPDCIVRSFEKYYLIARLLSKVTAQQYALFCRRIGACCDPAPARLLSLVNPRMIEAAYATVEYAFDADKLRGLMLDRVRNAGVTIRYSTRVTRLTRSGADGLEVELQDAHGAEVVQAQQALNCTYSLLNDVLARSGIDVVPLKHELTEMALVEPPEPLKDFGITVMCGPYFSVMPFPARGLHSFSHVRYTPHHEWQDAPGKSYHDPHARLERTEKHTAWPAIIRDASRYLPVLDDCRYRESMWEVKTVLPRSEADDSRPILFRRDHGLKGLHCILGGKIDNVYDVVDVIDSLGLS